MNAIASAAALRGSADPGRAATPAARHYALVAETPLTNIRILSASRKRLHPGDVFAIGLPDSALPLVVPPELLLNRPTVGVGEADPLA